MKTLVGMLFGTLLMLLFETVFKILQIVHGTKIARRKTGVMLLHVGGAIVRWSLPKNKEYTDFNQFKQRIKQSFLRVPWLYDIHCIKETDKSVRFETKNCPLTTALKNQGKSESAPYLYAGDFLVARENKLLWRFERTHSIGTDGVACNHIIWM